MPAYRTAATTYARFSYSYRGTGVLADTAGAASQTLVPTRQAPVPGVLPEFIFGVEEIGVGAVVERSASLEATAAIASAPQRVHQRSASLTATAGIALTGATTQVHSRSAALSASAAIASSPQRALQRSTALGATGAIDSSGTVVTSGATATLATTLNNSLAGPTYTSASFNPAVDDLIVVFCAISGVDDDAGTCTESAGGGTYTKIDHAEQAQGRIYMFVADQLCAATTARTISVDVSGGTNQGSGVFMWVVTVAGMDRSGLAAIKQSAKDENQASGQPAAPIFGSSVTSGDLVLGAVMNQTNPAGLTIPGDFDAELSDIGGLNPTRGGHLVKDDTGFTGTTVTWGSNSASAFCAAVLELDTSAAVSGVVHRAFDGVGNLSSSTNVNNLTGAFTAAAVIRQTTSGTTPVIWLHATSGFVPRVSMSLGTTGTLRLNIGGTTRVSTT